MKNLVITVPRLEIHRPPVSTAIIANCIKLAGHPVETLDLNCEFFHHLNNRDSYYAYDQVWDRIRPITHTETRNLIKFIKQVAFKKISNNDRIFISVFGSSGHLFTTILCKLIRKNFKNKIIILGGAGVTSSAIGKLKQPFGIKMKKAGLCNLYIVGEGETLVVDVLNNKLDTPGITNETPAQLNNIDDLPIPDYSFYDLDRYDYLSEQKEVFIVGSRGCVRNCTYCDVAHYWPKFRYRSGSNIAQEMITHYEKHGVTKFYFTDSLINGSMKAFNNMCEVLAKYNSTHKAGFSWGGQFIFRPKRQLPQDHFKMVAEAGGNEFYVGVETGSDKIRWEMDKKFTNEDIDYQLEEFNKNNLHVYFLMLIGYATETIDDHNDTLKMFQRRQKYVATGTIRGIDLGIGLLYLKDTPLERQIEEHGAYFLKNDFDLWQNTKNPDLDVWERVRRRIETHKEAIKYNWPIWRGTQRLEIIKQMLLKYQSFINNSNQTFKPIVKDGLHFIN